MKTAFNRKRKLGFVLKSSLSGNLMNQGKKVQKRFFSILKRLILSAALDCVCNWPTRRNPKLLAEA
jgi:hypothetical protein